MRRAVLLFATLMLSLLPALSALAADPAMEAPAHAKQATALDRLKALEGEWTGSAAHGDQKSPVTVLYRVTAGGSAVQETQFPGTPHEMVTMFTMDGGRLVLTHYCAAGNQPRMKARPNAAGDRLVFDFVGGAGIDPRKDFHMHDATYQFVDADHLHAEWTGWAKGRPEDKAVFELERKQPAAAH